MLGGVIDQPETLSRVRTKLAPKHFYSDANRWVFESISALADAGQPVDVVTLASALRERGKLDAIGGTSALGRLITMSAVVHVEAHVQPIIDAWTKRQLVNLGRRLTAEASNGAAPVDLIQGFRSDIELLGASEKPTGFHRLDAAAIFAELPPVNWLVQGLDMCPGAPVLIAGLGFSGKTVAVQSLAVSIAAGLDAWGTFRCRRGRVLHIDYEQGARLTSQRYQRLAAGLTLGPSDLGGLSLVSMPGVYLDGAQAEQTFMREAEGFDLMIVDSLHAAAPTIEENDANARRLLDLLTRVSERTGCVPLVIHHARKPSREAAGGARASIRGSGAIFDACSSVLVFEGEGGGKPTKASHVKARTSGMCADEFELLISDVEIDGNPRGGLAVTASARTESKGGPTHLERLGARTDAILGAVSTKPGCSKRYVRATVGGTATTIDDALAWLVEEGKLALERGPRGASSYRVPEASP